MATVPTPKPTPIAPEKLSAIDGAVRYFFFDLLDFFDDRKGYSNISDVFDFIYERHEITSNDVYFHAYSRFILAALRVLARSDLLEIVSDPYADEFLRPNERTARASQFDPLYDQLLRKYRALDQAGWVESAMRKIVRTFSAGEINEYLNAFAGQESEISVKDEVAPANELEEQQWEPLKIDRDGEKYQEAVASSEAALREIEASNGYAARDPEERNSIVLTISGTLKALREASPSRATVVQGLLVPLRYISKKFSDAALGEIAKVAVAKILAFLLS
jgi:hypothetical protein